MITVNAKHLSAALALCKHAVDAKATIPILRCVRVSASDGRLGLVTTDLEVTITAEVECNEQDFTPHVVPFKLLAAAIPKRGDVRIGTEGYSLVVETDAGRACVSDEAPPRDWPDLPAHPGGASLLDSRQLARALGFALPCVTTEDTRFSINGLLLDGEAIVATDGHRLAVGPIALPTSLPKLIVPFAALNAVASSTEPGAPMTVAARATERVWFQHKTTWGLWQIAARAIEGTFPNYSKVVPAIDSDGYAVARVARKPFMTALAGACKAIRANKVHVPMLRFASDGDTMSLRLDGLGGAELFSARVPCTGHPCTVGLNPLYLLDAAEACSGPDLEIHWKDATSQIAIRDGGAVVVVMPMRLEGAAAPKARTTPDATHEPEATETDDEAAPAAETVAA